MTVDIFDMKLHEEIQIRNSIGILRVDGGWIYQFKNGEVIFVRRRGEVIQ